MLCSKFLLAHLLIWTSYSAPNWCALKIISHSPAQHGVTASLYSWPLTLHLASQTLKPNVFSCLNLPIGANEKEWNWFTEILHVKWPCTSMYLSGEGYINRPGIGLTFLWKVNVWVDTWLITWITRSQLIFSPLKRNCSSKTPEESGVWLFDYTFHCNAVM